MGRPRFAIIVFAVLLAAGCYRGNDRFPAADHSAYDIPYANGYPGDEYLVLDIHCPERAADLPVIVYIHGGGWTAGDKGQMDVWSKRMSREGYVVFNVNYRLAPRYPFPAAANDCLGALLWVSRHAPDYGGDPGRIGVTGGSAGGHLTALVSTAAADPFWRPTGFESDSAAGLVTAQVPFFGVYDFNHRDVIRLLDLNEKFLGGKPDEVPDNYRLASPINFVSAGVPPTLLVCGKLDPLYPQSNLYYRALQDAGAPVEYVTYPLETHGFDSVMWLRDSKDAFNKMMEFFNRELKGKQ